MDTRKIKVKTLTNQTYKLEFDATQPVSAFKQKISEVSSVPTDRQRLVYMGKLLLDDQPLNTYVKDDDQTIHLMARTESQPVGQDGPSQQTQSGPSTPPLPQPPIGFNPNVLFGEINNLTGLVMRSMGNPGDLGNLFTSIMGNIPGMQVQAPNTNSQQPSPINQPHQQQQQQTQPNQVPGQSQPQQQRPLVPQVHVHTNAQPPQAHTRPHPHPHPHLHHHHHHPQQPQPQQQQQQPRPATVDQRLPPPSTSAQTGTPIVLPFNVLYTLGTLITQLNGEGATFPGPPLPHMGSRNNVQVMGAFLSNWHFQMMRALPYIYRLGELLQREPALEDSLQREDVNVLLARLSPILEHIVMSTNPVINVYRNLRLGSNPGQFTVSPQPVPPIQINPLPFPGFQFSQHQQPAQTTAPPSSVNQAQGIPAQIQVPQFTISAIIQQSIGDNVNQATVPPGSTQNTPAHVIQQTTFTIPTESLPQQFNPFNLLGLQFGQPPVEPQQSTSQSEAPQQETQPQQPATTTSAQQPEQPLTTAQQRNPPVSVPQPQGMNQQPIASRQPQPAALHQQLNNVLQSNPMLSSLLNPASLGMVTTMDVRSVLQPEDPTQEQSVYALIFGDIKVSDLMSSFTAQNFSYLNTHRQSIQRGTVEALNRFSGSKEALIDKMATDICNVVVSEELRSSSMEGFEPRELAEEITKKHILRLISLILSQEDDFEHKFVKILKTLVGELIYELAQGNEQGPEGVMSSLRTSIAREYNPLLMGFAGIAFSLIEGRIAAMYNEYRADLEREKARTANDVQSEEQLIEAINQASKNDQEQILDVLKKPHSSSY